MSFSSFTDSWVIVYILVFSFALGAVMGSAMTCWGDRLADGKSWLKGRSECDVCHHVLGLGDLVPIVSYVIHGGKCKYCGSVLSKKYLLTEVLLGFGFVLVVFHYWSFDLLIIRDWLLMCVLLALSVCDFDCYIIPDRFIVMGIVIWVVFEILSGGNFKDGLIGGFVISGFVLIISLVMDKVLHKDSMGGGDIKLLFVVGLYLGLVNGLFCLILSCVLGLVFVALLRSEKIAFGPAISLATGICLIVGSSITSWYLGML